MDSNKLAKKQAITLFIIWVISGFGLTIFSKFRQIYYAFNNIEIPSSTTPDLYVWILLFVTLIYFIPMLFVIIRKAKQAQMKWLIIIATILMIYYSITLVLAIVVAVAGFLLT